MTNMQLCYVTPTLARGVNYFVSHHLSAEMGIQLNADAIFFLGVGTSARLAGGSLSRDSYAGLG